MCLDLILDMNLDVDLGLDTDRYRSRAIGEISCLGCLPWTGLSVSTTRSKSRFLDSFLDVNCESHNRN